MKNTRHFYYLKYYKRPIFLLCIGCVLNLLCSFTHAQVNKADSLFQTIAQEKNDSIAAHNCLKGIIALIHFDNDRLIKEAKFYENLLKPYPKIHATSLQITGWIYGSENNYAQAIYHYELARKIYRDTTFFYRLQTDMGYFQYLELELEVAKKNLKEVLAFFENIPLTKEEYEGLSTLASANTTLGLIELLQNKNPTKTENYLKQALKYSESIKRKDWQLSALQNLAYFYVTQGDYQKAVQYIFDANQFSGDTKLNDERIAMQKLTIGKIYFELAEYDKAFNYYEQSEKEALKSGLMPILSLINIRKIDLLIKKKDLVAADKNKRKFKENIEKQPSNIAKTDLLLAEAKLAFAKKEIPDAKKYLTQLFNICQQHQLAGFEIEGLLLASKIALENQQLLVAKRQCQKAVQLAITTQNTPMTFYGKKQLLQICELLKESHQIIQLQKDLMIMQDTLQLTAAGKQAILNLITEKEQHANAFVPTENLLTNSVPFYSTRIFLPFLCLIGLLVYLLKLKNTSNYKARAEQVNEKQNAEALDFRLQNVQSLQKETKTLTHNILSLEQQLKVSNDLHTHALKSKLQSINMEANWEEVQLQFYAIYPHFIQGLKEQQCKFTPNMVRHIICIKLSLSVKETAALLYTSQEAVKKARYRLKKNLGLPNTVNLHDYFSSL